MRVRYFGTDGIRGPYGGPRVNPEFFRRLGAACREYLCRARRTESLSIAVGRDPRPSGSNLSESFIHGFSGPETRVFDLGVLPTPAIAASVQRLRADFGASITASHNPASDNGIKFFDRRGLKLIESEERAFESIVDSVAVRPSDSELQLCDITVSDDGVRHYIERAVRTLPEESLNGWKIVADTANGATAQTTPAVLRALGAEVVHIGNHTDGMTINDRCGSEHPEVLAVSVLEHRAHFGIAHDGDGDRAVFADETGSILNGDEILAILGLSAMRAGKLSRDTLVTTVMSNLGLDKALEAEGGRVERVSVGDRNVMQRMMEGGFTLGGESSGHIIFVGNGTTGDGLYAALQVAAAMLETGEPLSRLRRCIKLFPQFTRDLRVSEKIPLNSIPALSNDLAEIENAVGPRGRILVRYSGTEPKIRLLVESEDSNTVSDAMAKLADAVIANLPVID